jgi:hypothetical protein
VVNNNQPTKKRTMDVKNMLAWQTPIIIIISL